DVDQRIAFGIASAGGASRQIDIDASARALVARCIETIVTIEDIGAGAPDERIVAGYAGIADRIVAIEIVIAGTPVDGVVAIFAPYLGIIAVRSVDQILEFGAAEAAHAAEYIGTNEIPAAIVRCRTRLQ